jgi:hypothetical protein
LEDSYPELTANINLTTLGIVGGALEKLVIQHTTLYMSVGQQVHIVDVSIPAQPRFVGKAIVSYDIGGFQVAGTRLYVVGTVGNNQTCRDTGFVTIFDVSNPQTPVLLGQLPLVDGAYDVAISGSYLYVMAPYGLSIIDASNPAAPFEATYYEHDVPIQASGSMKLVGTTIYITSNYYGLFVIDVSNPLAPRKLINYEDISRPLSLEVVGGYLFVGSAGGIVVLNIQNPAAPQYVTALGGVTTYDLFVSGTTLYTAGSFDGLYTIDVTNPTAPQQLGLTDDHIYVAEGVVAVGGYAYVANESGMRVFDVSVPTQPTWVADYNDPGTIVDVDVQGNYAYVADLTAMHLVDISNPSVPQTVGSIPTSHETWAVDVVGSYAYIADLYAGIKIVDVSVPTAPTITGVYTQHLHAKDIAVQGNYAYVASISDEPYAFSVLRILDPSNPQLLSIGTTTLRFADTVVVQGDYAYVGSGLEGALAIMDISTPLLPQQVGSYTLEGVFADIAVKGNYAYVLDGSAYAGGIIVLDISNPAAPVEVHTLTFRDYLSACGSATVEDMHLIGDYLVLAEDNLTESVFILDISNPINPQLVSQYPFDGGAYSVFGLFNRLYIGGRLGLHVLQLDGSGIETPVAPTNVEIALPDFCDTFSLEEYHITVSPENVSFPVVLTINEDGTEEMVELTETTPIWSGTLPCKDMPGATSTITVTASNPGGQTSTTQTITAINKDSPPEITHAELAVSPMTTLPNDQTQISAKICTPYQLSGRIFTNGKAFDGGMYTMNWMIEDEYGKTNITLASLAAEAIERKDYLGLITLFQPSSENDLFFYMTPQSSAPELPAYNSMRPLQVADLSGSNKIQTCVQTFATAMGKQTRYSYMPTMQSVGVVLPQAMTTQEPLTDVVSLIVENSNGQQTGFLPSGVPLREIPNAQVGKFATGWVVVYPAESGTTVQMTTKTTTTVSLYAGMVDQDGEGTMVTHRDMSLPSSTTATLQDKEAEYALSLDTDGDGKEDDTHVADTLDTFSSLHRVYLPVVQR